jgi:hypothetical protein
MAVNQKSIKNLRPARKGEVRNPHGAPKKLPELETLMAKVMGEEKGGITAMEAIISALRLKASKGDVRAAEVLLNRGYGLPKQTIQTTGETVVRFIRDDGNSDKT